MAAVYDEKTQKDSHNIFDESLACFCVDISSIVSSALLLFGTELGICGLMKLYDKGVEQAERRAEERRKRRMSVKQAEWESKEELRENENE